MRSKTSEWFETKVKYDKLQEDGTAKPIKESYVVDALSFTEAEETIIDEMSSYISGEFAVSDIKKATYKEIFFSESMKDDKWYRVKLQFITIDEKSGKEKYTTNNFLVQSNSLQNAVKNFEAEMSKGMQDWKIVSVTETAFIDVFEHGAKDAKPEKDDVPEYEAQPVEG